MRLLTLTSILLIATLDARAARWDGYIAGGGDIAVSPNTGGHGFVLFEAIGRKLVGGGDLLLRYNTDSAEVGLARLQIVENTLELSVRARGQALLAGLLSDYYIQGARDTSRGFNASNALVEAKLQWHALPHQTFELLLRCTQWFFSTSGDTSTTLVLPDDPTLLTASVGYIYWKQSEGADAWLPHLVFPRFEGLALGVFGVVDARSNTTPWGETADPRNAPKSVAPRVEQWLRYGRKLGSLVRVQVHQQLAWGSGQDDLSRHRIGGLNPYVVVIPGLPWPALLSERLLHAQASAHIKLGKGSPHEVGLLIAGGAFNDVRRTGALDKFGGAGGIALLGNLRFGRVDLHLQAGWSFPVEWLEEQPHFNVMAAVGAEVF